VENYCPLPFKHVFVEPRGVKPCCSYKYQSPVSVEQWIKSPELKELQSSFLQGKIPEGCSFCIENEKKSNHSTRLGAIKDYGTEIFTETQIDYVDYRSSNICNFKCRSCEPYFSNGIANEIKHNKSLKDFLSIKNDHLHDLKLPDSKTASTELEDYHWIIENLSNIKRLMFTGGEPTKIPLVKKIIDHIRHHGIYDVQVMITSNASFTDPYWTEITRELPNIHWTLSLDAVGTAAEIIRAGTVWPVVSRNIETMFDISPSVNIGTIVTNLNVFQLKPLFRFVNDLGYKYSHRSNGRTQFIQFCQWPMYMSPDILSNDQKTQALDYLASFERTKLQKSQIDAIDALTKILQSQEKTPKNRLELSQQYNKLLDQIRNENHEWLFTPMH
jgi:sulfatase maturation enzyme AslB (radical SAM superfamily)